MFEITKELGERIRAFLAVQQPVAAAAISSAKIYCPNTCANNCYGSCKGTCGMTCSNTLRRG